MSGREESKKLEEANSVYDVTDELHAKTVNSYLNFRPLTLTSFGAESCMNSYICAENMSLKPGARLDLSKSDKVLFSANVRTCL